MNKKETDDRFAKLNSDPRFRTYRKVDKKLKVDSRFKSMFTENKFKLKYSMDKRGKNKKHLISDDYKKFYRLSDEEDADKEKDDADKSEKEKINETVVDVPSKKVYATDNDSEEEEDEKNGKGEAKEDLPPAERRLTHSIGYHRGLKHEKDDDDETDGSSSSSSESEESDDEENLEVEHDWAELDRDADQIEEATSRIAICNADWDCINAQDLFVLLNSFKKATGDIHYVRIYYSKFGEERLKIEEMKGPSEFIFGKATNVEEIKDDEGEAEKEETQSDDDDDASAISSNDEAEEDGETEPKAIEKLRKYQLERLKYYYAVVEFDSPETAEAVYSELDGMEYETSSTTLDIRFVPEEMDFEDVRLKEECTSMPDSNYKAPNFINSALQQSHVTLTWDETDHKRKTVFDKAFEKGNEDDLKAYLATSSEDDEEEEEIEIDEGLKDDEKINKYKDLLKSLEKGDGDDDVQMEVTWDPSLKANAQSLINKKGDAAKTEATIDDNLADSEDGDEHDDEGEDIHDDDDDQLISDDSEMEKKKEKDTSKDKYKKWKKKRAAKKEAAAVAAKNANSEDASNLELLMVNLEGKSEGNGKKHFNYKEIVESYKGGKKGKSSKEDASAEQAKDSFKFNADDPRFGAIFTSHLYNVDQSDPSFKKTEAFDQILNKRKSKAEMLIKDEKSVVEKMEASGKAAGVKSWSSLANKVKSKAAAVKRGATKVSPVAEKGESEGRFNANKKFKR